MTYRCECGTCQYKHRAEAAERELAEARKDWPEFLDPARVRELLAEYDIDETDLLKHTLEDWERWRREAPKQSVELTAVRQELAEARAREQRLREQLLRVLDAVLACETRHDERGHAYLAVPARSLHDPAAEMAALREALRPTSGEPGGEKR